jgi:arginase
MLSALHWRVSDGGDLDFDETHERSKTKSSVPFTGLAKNHERVGHGCAVLADEVESHVRKGRFPLVLGGDHSIGMGTLAGLLRIRPNTGVLWIDAHADLNTPFISDSGNIHGMPIGMMMEGVLRPDQTVPGFEWLLSGPRLKPDSIVYVGLRDVDPAERKLIYELGIQAYTITDIDHYGIGGVMDMALEYLCQHDADRPLHLSYDIDAVDPNLAPATGTAVRGGLTFREAHYVAEATAASGNLASAEIVELNPTLSHEEGASDTIELGLQLITSLMGKSII